MTLGYGTFYAFKVRIITENHPKTDRSRERKGVKNIFIINVLLK
ncbi:hypothetical protein EDWATA_00149 [Edwardsiella tarda ATCC 23685]|uniref:Uncharacterized protein n=1 Tax=Edwardsiella tarda ATCC 23685 TaxID=500638 RepID=D4F0C6_EDWTA|nr:hypothetical protein EDWATA_00149 [Edwardsiella tarda ATCC 23685]